MAQDVPKIAYFSVLPTPYRQPLLDRLASSDDMDVRVFFLAGSEADRSWSVDVSHPKMEILPVRTFARRKNGKPIFIHYNPGVPDRLTEGRFDLVVVPGWAQPTSVRTLRWCATSGVPGVMHSETHRLGIPPSTRDRIKRRVVSRIASWASGGLAAGSAARDYMAGLGVPRDRIWILPNTPDADSLIEKTTRLSAERARFLDGIGLKTKKVALFVGRLIEAKAPLDMLAAYEKVIASGEDCGLVIVGDGELEGAVRARIAERNLDSVRLLGFREGEALLTAYAAADLFVLTSRQEPWGAVVNEAAAAGLPLLVTDVVGAGVDLVRQGENGFRVPVGDVDAIAEAWRRILAMDRDAAAEVSRGIARRWGTAFAVDQFRQCVLTLLADRR